MQVVSVGSVIEMAEDNSTKSHCRRIACLLLLSSAAHVSAAQVSGTKPRSVRGRPPSRPVFDPAKNTIPNNTLVSAPPTPGANNPIPATQAANPGTVTLQNGLLTIKADNSDLGEILQQVAARTGMVVDGYENRLRIFGVYGPRDPQAVLADLLVSSGYNFIMVGVTQDGAPKLLTLTPRTGSPSPPSAAPAAVSAIRETSEPSAPDRPGPGAILAVPPARPENPEVRREQRLQRLQQMRDKLTQPEPKP